MKISCSPALSHFIHMLIHKEDGRFTQKSFTITPSSLPPPYIHSRYCYVASVRTLHIFVLEQLDNSFYSKFLSAVKNYVLSKQCVVSEQLCIMFRIVP